MVMQRGSPQRSVALGSFLNYLGKSNKMKWMHLCGLSHRVELMDTSREKGKMEVKMQGGGKKDTTLSVVVV